MNDPQKTIIDSNKRSPEVRDILNMVPVSKAAWMFTVSVLVATTVFFMLAPGSPSSLYETEIITSWNHSGVKPMVVAHAELLVARNQGFQVGQEVRLYLSNIKGAAQGSTKGHISSIQPSVDGQFLRVHLEFKDLCGIFICRDGDSIARKQHGTVEVISTESQSLLSLIVHRLRFNPVQTSNQVPASSN